MINEELNKRFIRYLIEDKTNCALMFSAPWGRGKTYYIRKCLIPAIEESGEYLCNVISAYGLKNIDELAKEIYNSFNQKTLRYAIEQIQHCFEKENLSNKITIPFENTGLIVSDDFKRYLFKDVDFAKKLLIIEDVERSNINIFEIFGYVNYLCEYKDAKIILVTNEDVFIKFNKSKENDKKIVYSEETEKYFKAKEKTIRETIFFNPNYWEIIDDILNSFDNPIIKKMLENNRFYEPLNKISFRIFTETEFTRETFNFRSLIYGVQKTCELFSCLNESEVKISFFEDVLLGNIAYAFKYKNGNYMDWDDKKNGSDLGSEKHPLFKFSYDFLLDKEISKETILKSQDYYYLKKEELLNNKSLNYFLSIIHEYYIKDESEVQKALKSIYKFIKDDVIKCSDYAHIANYLISIKHNVPGNNEIINQSLNEMLNKEKYDDDNFVEHTKFYNGIALDSAEENEEMADFEHKLLSKKESCDNIGNYDYSREKLLSWLDSIQKNNENTGRKGFAKFLNTEKFDSLISKCSAKEISEIRKTFKFVYRISNAAYFFQEDPTNLDAILESVNRQIDNKQRDKIQILQLKYFSEDLKTILTKLRASI